MKTKYQLGDLFREGNHKLMVLRPGNSKGVYYCRVDYRVGSSRMEYRSERELDLLERMEVLG